MHAQHARMPSMPTFLLHMHSMPSMPSFLLHLPSSPSFLLHAWQHISISQLFVPLTLRSGPYKQLLLPFSCIAVNATT